MIHYIIKDEETGEEISGTAETLLLCGANDEDADVYLKGYVCHAHDIAHAIVEAAMTPEALAMRQIVSRMMAALVPGSDNQSAKYIGLLLDDLKQLMTMEETEE